MSMVMTKELSAVYYAHDIAGILTYLETHNAKGEKIRRPRKKRKDITQDIQFEERLPNECVRCSRPRADGSDLCKVHLGIEKRKKKKSRKST